MLKLILPKDHIEHSLCGLKKTLEHHFFIISYESIVLLCEFTFSEGKQNFEETLHLQPWSLACLFHFTNTYVQITLHSTDFSGDKYVAV